MVESLIEQCGGGGFYLYDHDKLIDDMRLDTRKNTSWGDIRASRSG